MRRAFGEYAFAIHFAHLRPMRNLIQCVLADVQPAPAERCPTFASPHYLKKIEAVAPNESGHQERSELTKPAGFRQEETDTVIGVTARSSA